MKTIGLIGGMSWESSAVYYDLINKKVREKLGGFHSCKNIMVTVDFAEIEKLQHLDDWETLDKMMVTSAKQLEAAGADIVVLCTNTMHLCSPAIIENISIPFLHIAEATGLEIVKKGLKKVALLGTKFTMEKDFYKKYILDNFGVEVIIPADDNREQIHTIIYNELVQGKIKNESRKIYKQIIGKLEQQGAEGIILGCTEIPLLISGKDVNIPIFDTTTIHAEKAVEWALKQ
ncbi:MAG: aspartate/glutamate racemase family protein [Prolixibacteraceae bacterium]|jgi:aspartate racemase|nr:aspartate/glutamate racemase family protein [Prolixibacteraceae bacterium]MBT6005507.1 aspartate/glutamate racemase family protein [Prolixibacteraceae bacterium]MBT6763399.1 aspartate/glutamate racemase family protein [Prolixibacteraceae bacterium]MBT6997824.1 aspartate/glutamate racemase family protein [Prolixibacteraceae bacterium]MBT7393423.1 aspartate/glutamate racemase family protein [Prolixibacteraceae bacterium]